MFEFLGKYFWVIAIVLNLINYRWKTAHLPPQSNGDSSDNGATLYRRGLGVIITPWLVMGAGIVFGGVPGLWNYLRPQDLNPFVWAWYLCVLGLACGIAYWIIFRGGARRAVELQLTQVLSFARPMQMSEEWMKVFAVIRPVFVVFWIWLAWHIDARAPVQVH